MEQVIRKPLSGLRWALAPPEMFDIGGSLEAGPSRFVPSSGALNSTYAFRQAPPGQWEASLWFCPCLLACSSQPVSFHASSKLQGIND